MITKNQRISRTQINWIFKKGSRISNPYLGLIYSANTEGRNRYSIAISKKICRKATQRNYLRRQFYEILKSLPNQELSFDFLLMIRPRIIKLSYKEKEAIINDLFTNLFNHH